MRRVDSAILVFKQVGETEKNPAPHSGCGAAPRRGDVPTSRRLEVLDGPDRHARLEMSYLVQQPEGHGGLVTLASNLRNDFHQAYRPGSTSLSPTGTSG